MSPHLKAALPFLLCTLLTAGAGAKEAVPAAADPVLEARTLRIAAELRCLVCQNQTLADSDAPLAQDLREQLRSLLRQGRSDEQVLAYLSDRYGDFVRYRPPLKPSTLLLWFGPAVLLAGGLSMLVVVLRRRSRLGDEHFEEEVPDVTDRGNAEQPS